MSENRGKWEERGFIMALKSFTLKKNSLAQTAFWLLVSATGVFISACAGARTQTDAQPEDSPKMESSLPRSPAQQIDSTTVAEVLQLLSIVATRPESQDSIKSPAIVQPNEVSSASGQNAHWQQNSVANGHLPAPALSIALQYLPNSEAQTNEALQRPLGLDDCIRIALGRNISLLLLEGDVAKAEASLSGSYGKFLPLLTLEGAQEYKQQKLPLNPLVPTDPTQLSFNIRSVVGGIQQRLPSGAIVNFRGVFRHDLNSAANFGAPPTKSENLAYNISVTQPLLRGAWRTVARSEITLARHDRQIQEHLLLDAKLATIYSVKSAFYKVLLQRELIKIHQIAVKRDSALIDLSESMTTAKRASRRDILSARIRLAEDRAALIRSQTEYQAALDILKEVVGLPLDLSLTLAEMALSFTPVALDERTLVRLAMHNNPSILSAEVSIARAELSHRVVRDALLAQLDLNISFSGDLNSDTDQNKNLWTSGWVAGLSLSLPLFNREADAAAVREQITVSQALDRLADTRRQIILSIRRIIHEAQSTAEELNALKGTISAAEEKVDYANTMFNLGRASNLDITDSQEDLLKAQNDYLGNVVDYYSQLALLESLTGQSLTP